MTIAFRTEERIAREPAVVWKRLTDWERAPEWMAGIEGLRAAGPVAVGTTLVFHARGRERSSEITGLVPGRELTLTSRQGPVTADYTYRCEPDGDGTRVELVAACGIRGPLRLLGPVLRRLVKRADGGQLRALRTLVEQG